MSNPILQSAYSIEYVADYLGLKVVSLKEKLADYPECYPPTTIIGRTGSKDGLIVFPKRLFEKWLEDNASTPEIRSDEADKYREHA